MYKRVTTKTEFRNAINDALIETRENIKKFPELTFYKTIADQIVQIKEDVINKKLKLSLFEIINKYYLDTIAVKNFDLEHDQYAQKLRDIAGLSYKYWDLPE